MDVNFRMGQPEGLPGDCTLLHIAAYRGDVKYLEFLMAHGAELNAKDSLGRSAVLYAAKNKHRRIVRLLERKGANMTGVSKSAILPEECITPCTPQPSAVKFCFF